jgi:hypothetical protein
MIDMASRWKWDVFVSFSSRDRAKAVAIARDLKRAGMAVWIDSDHIAAGDRVRAALDEGIRRSRSVLALVSSRSLNSQWVLNELDAAMLREIDERRKILIPVLLGNIEHEQLPRDIRGKNYIDLRRNFAVRYKQNRTSLLNAVLAATTPRDHRATTIPVGDAAMRYVLVYRYRAANETHIPEDTFIDALVDQFVVKIPTTFGAVKTKRAFLKAYGRWGVRQLLKFFLDHSPGLSLTRGFTEEQMVELLESIDLFMLMFDVQKLARKSGETVLMRVVPNEEVRYRQTSESRWLDRS